MFCRRDMPTTFTYAVCVTTRTIAPYYLLLDHYRADGSLGYILVTCRSDYYLLTAKVPDDIVVYLLPFYHRSDEGTVK